MKHRRILWLVLAPFLCASADRVWAQTPAGGRVQSGGQMIAAGFDFAAPGIQGQACNGHLSRLNP